MAVEGAVLLEALEQEVAGSMTIPDTGDVADDMRGVVGNLIRRHADPNFGPHVVALIAESHQDPGARAGGARAVRQGTPRAARGTTAASGAARTATDFAGPEAILEVVFGALYHRLLLRSGALEAAHQSFVVDVVFTGAAASTDPASTGSNLG